MNDALRAAQAAAALIGCADAMIVTAGAGMGIDSGLPDFRGAQGFWRAYPALGRACIAFEDIATPQAFRDDPALAWGFYGHRLNLYRATEPHAGFRILREMAARQPHGAFVFTSNVDGQFQKAGFDDERIVECHGSIHWLQCLSGCGGHVWPADGYAPQVDAGHGRIAGCMPECPLCRGLARPNILMFGDWEWIADRTHAQQLRFRRWRARVERPVVIELGAGTAIPTVRRFGEAQGCPLVRINPDPPATRGAEDIGIALGALAGLAAIRAALDA